MDTNNHSPYEEPLLHSIANRLDKMEQRLAALESHRAAPTPSVASAAPVRVHRKEVRQGLRATRRVALIIGLILFFFGSFLLQTYYAMLVGFLLLIYCAIISVVVKPVYMVVPAKPTTTPDGIPLPPQTHTVHGNVEQDIGKRIFAWTGIIAMLIGLIFFVTYSFQHFGAPGKLAAGYGSAILIFIVGRRLRRSVQGFSYVLEGGAWAGAYFMTYATSFVPSVNVIHNPLLTLSLLLVLTGVMALVSLEERSQPFTAAAFLLGFITAALGSEQSLFTLWAGLLTSIGVLLVAIRLRWFPFAIGATIGAYAAFFVWTSHISVLTNNYAFSGVLFIILYGMLFGLSHLMIAPQSKDEEQAVQIGVVLNVGLAYASGLYLFSLSHVHIWVVTLFFAGVLACFYGISRLLPSTNHLRLPYLVMCIVALTAFVPQKFAYDSVAITWSAETAALLLIGVMTNTRVLRLLGYLVGMGASVLLAERITSFSGTTTPTMSTVVAIFFGIALWIVLAGLLQRNSAHVPDDERPLLLAPGDIAVILLAFYISQHLTRAVLPLALGVEGALVLAVGFATKLRHLRILGLGVLIYTVLHVLLVELTGLDTFGKMMSFFAVGVILLAVAYLYNKSHPQKPTPVA